MALQTINLGEVVNDGTGDDLRTAFEKVVFNFNDIEDRLDDTIIVTNIGSIGQGVFKEQIDREYKFKKLAGDVNIVVNDDGDTLSIDLDIDSQVDFNLQNAINLGNVSVFGDITLEGTNSKLLGNVTGIVTGVLNGVVYAPTTPGSFGLMGNVVGVNSQSGPQDISYRPALVDGISVLDLSRTVNNFDYGNVGGSGNLTFDNPIQYLLNQIGTDMGIIDTSAPLNGSSPFSIDLGTI